MFRLPPESRLKAWREFRKELDTLTLDEAIAAVIDFWNQCPFTPYYLEEATPQLWPSPWELIIENHYCDLAKSLGMLYTLYYTKHGLALDIEIQIYSDPVTNVRYNTISICNGKYILNFQNGFAVENKSINNNLALLYRYNSVDLKLEEY